MSTHRPPNSGAGIPVLQGGEDVNDADPERCGCTHAHLTADGRCGNPSLRSEDPVALAAHTECGCCAADCPDVHPEPRGLDFVPGSATIAAEYVETLAPEKQRELRELEARGELRILPQAQMRLGPDLPAP